MTKYFAFGEQDRLVEINPESYQKRMRRLLEGEYGSAKGKIGRLNFTGRLLTANISDPDETEPQILVVNELTDLGLRGTKELVNWPIFRVGARIIPTLERRLWASKRILEVNLQARARKKERT